MAGDWIKMRVWLSRDPKVISMAKWLANEPQFTSTMGLGGIERESDRRNVTVALCVTGLLVTWGTARERGDRVGDDLVLKKCDLSVLDDMTGMRHFGHAMATVEWAEEVEGPTIRFPNFFKDNESPDDKHRRQNAERQARFRASHGNGEVTEPSNVTVTLEKRREEKIKPLRPVAPDSFSRFWVAWPSSVRKVAKAKCLDIWNRRRLDDIADKIVSHVTAMRESKQWRDGYDPAPLTYLNQSRWEDEVHVTPQPTKTDRMRDLMRGQA